MFADSIATANIFFARIDIYLPNIIFLPLFLECKSIACNNNNEIGNYIFAGE